MFSLLLSKSFSLTCIYSGSSYHKCLFLNQYSTQTSSTSFNGGIFSSSSYPSISTLLLAFITMTLFLKYYKATRSKLKQREHLSSQLREIGVTLLPLIMTEVSFFSLGYLTLPSSFGFAE
jgi:hypothetical protein